MGGDTAVLPALRESKKDRVPYSSASRGSHARRYSPADDSAEMASLVSTRGHDVFCILDGALNCHSLSENWHKLSGFSAAESIGNEFASHIAPDHVRRIRHYLTQSDDNSAPLRFQIKHQNGGWRWCELQVAQAQPEQSVYKCLLRDVSELVAAQGKYEKAQLEAELAVKSRSEFLANMSHELRTPLNAILGFTQMMDKGTFGEIGHPKYHDYIGDIQESGITLLSKINDLLEIANIDSGRMALNEAPADITAIIRQAIEFHSHHAFTEQVSLRDHLPHTPMLAVVDRIRMLQVLTNLVSNAIKYNRAGGAVDIHCEMRKDGGINIVIKDNGGGILPTHLQNILTAFRQDNSFFARNRDCVGLGLALSKEIVKLHQGRIHIESEHGKGTLLTIHLPRERTVKTAPERKKA